VVRCDLTVSEAYNAYARGRSMISFVTLSTYPETGPTFPSFFNGCIVEAYNPRFLRGPLADSRACVFKIIFDTVRRVRERPTQKISVPGELSPSSISCFLLPWTPLLCSVSFREGHSRNMKEKTMTAFGNL